MIFLGVAHILTNEAKIYDAVTLAAAILHDTVEDTKTTFEEIKLEFGEEVMNRFLSIIDTQNFFSQNILIFAINFLSPLEGQNFKVAKMQQQNSTHMGFKHFPSDWLNTQPCSFVSSQIFQ